MQRRCCNAPTDGGPLVCQPCATPISPCTQTDYTLRVEAWGVSGVSNGTGMLTFGDPILSVDPFPDQGLDCMIGTCGTVPYTRKKVFVDDFYATDAACVDRVSDICADMTGESPMPQFGWHELRWRGCAAPTEGNIYYDDQSDAVRIQGMFLDRRWCSTTYQCTGCYGGVSVPPCNHVPVGLCNDGTAYDGCLTIIEVEYEFTDGGEVGRWTVNDQGNCIRTPVVFSISQVYKCTYGRRNATNEKVAVGQYKLLRVEVSPFNTYKAQPTTPPSCCDPCNSDLLIACAPNYASAPVTSPTPWKPPQFITVARSC